MFASNCEFRPIRIFRLFSSSPGNWPMYCFLNAASLLSWSSISRFACSSWRERKAVVFWATASRSLRFSSSSMDVSPLQMSCASFGLLAVKFT